MTEPSATSPKIVRRCSSTPSIGTIHIELANVRVRIEGNVDAATVRTVLECLAR